MVHENLVNFINGVNWLPYRVKEADVSSVILSSERTEELWAVSGLHTEYRSTLLMGIWQHETQGYISSMKIKASFFRGDQGCRFER